MAPQQHKKNYFFVENAFSNNLLWLHAIHTFYTQEKIVSAKKNINVIKSSLSDTFTLTENLIFNYEKKALILIQRYILIITVTKLVKKFSNLSKNEQLKFLTLAISKLEVN